MVIDTSSLLAIAFLEPEVSSLMDMLDSAHRRLISAASVGEARIVAESRAGILGGDRLDKIIVELGLDIEPVTADQARIARFAYRRPRRTRHCEQSEAIHQATVYTGLLHPLGGFAMTTWRVFRAILSLLRQG